MISPSSKLALKWAWLALVVLCVASYGLTRREVIASSLALVSGTLLLLSASFIVGAKLCLANAMRGAAQRAGIALGYGDAFRIYNLTQLAKYIPGAIWQFVGRFAVLRDKGISTAAIRDSLLAEQGWIAGSALICGLVLVLPYYFSGGSIDFAAGLDLSSQSVLGLATVVLVVVLVLVIKAPPRLWHWAWTLTPDARGLLGLLLIWIFLGLAFYVTLLPFGFPIYLWHLAFGVYALAYLSGLLVPFAPAGLGVRDTCLALAIAPFVSLESAIVVAGLNRVLYFACELLLAALAIASSRSWSLRATTPGESA